MTLRSEGQFNTVVYEEEDLYRGNTRRDVVMMARGRRGAPRPRRGRPRSRVATETGALRGRRSPSSTSAAGNLAMYYPEANALVPRRIDPASGTPAFKSVVAHVVPPPFARP